MKNRRLGIAALLLLSASFPVLAQPPRAGHVELPLRRIVLFSSGVGYFQREGTVDGNARIDLQFPAADVNDLLKSMVLQDLDGGLINSVTYDSRDPVEKTLKSFALDLTNNPSIGQLLGQARGERIEVISFGEPGQEGKPVTLTGSIVGVQKQRRPVGRDQVIETEQLNLLTEEGLHGIALEKVQRIHFLKPELQQEFRKALEVLATGHDKQKKTVSLNFLGNGKRRARVAYITESPLWKTSYRLSLEEKDGKKDAAFLQGWAVVENTSDEDWHQVRMGLVSGRPISFQMDLYDPLYVPRPVVEPELFASLRPQTYSGDLAAKDKAAAPQQDAESNAPSSPEFAPRAMLREQLGRAKKSPAGEGRGAGIGGGAATPPPGGVFFGSNGMPAPAPAGGPARADGLSLSQGVANAAVATELGEYFKYELEQPVSLPRQKSALLPIVNQAVEASKVSIYNEGVHAKFPLLGLRFKNTTGLHLMQGPITIFEGDTYAGDARITDLQPKETRLVSYAVDLGTEVAPEQKPGHDDLVAVKLFKGLLETTHQQRQTKVYTIKNRSEHPRHLLIEHPIHPGWNLLTPEKPAERSREVYRFTVDAKPNQTEKVAVVEETRLSQQIALSNSPDETIRFFLRATSTSAKVKQALEEVLKRKAQLAETQHAVGVEEQALQAIGRDQERLRANIQRVPPTSQAYQRYLKKFDEQETEIESRQAKLAQLQKTAEQQRQAYESFLANLSGEWRGSIPFTALPATEPVP
jgi:hypothetical protein